MAEVKLAAGAKLDVLNRHELKTVLEAARRDWFSQVSRGDRYRRFSAVGTVAADGVAGSLVIGGAEAADAGLGPAEGFVWDVRRLAVFGLGANDTVKLFVNDDGPSSGVHPSVSGFLPFDQAQLVMYPGDVLLVKGTGLTATGNITVTGQARELPMPLAYRLGGG